MQTCSRRVSYAAPCHLKASTYEAPLQTGETTNPEADYRGNDRGDHVTALERRSESMPQMCHLDAGLYVET